MYLDKQHPRPVYLQLKELLQNKIEQGIYLSHQQLPSERDLCQSHNLSRMTTRRALQQLIAEGFAYTKAGKGTFVSQKPNVVAEQSIIAEQSTLNFADHKASSICKQKLISALISFDCVGAERVIHEALADQTLEAIAGTLFLETINQLEQLWQKGEINLLIHNYAVTSLRSQLIAMTNAATMSETGLKILLVCAPEDQHEIGLLLLALSLRRRGYVVIYLGSNINLNGFDYTINIIQPDLICFSAATEQSAINLVELVHHSPYKWVVNTEKFNKAQLEEKPLLTFGGVAFNHNPGLILNMPGYYLGNSIPNAVINIQEILRLQEFQEI